LWLRLAASSESPSWTERRPTMTGPEDVFRDADDFLMEEGTRMCPRCRCCAVGVSAYDPPHAGTGRIESWSAIPATASILARDPSTDKSAGLQAWYCRGGCNDSGEHPKSWPADFPTFIARVKINS
jgi:hypothetical protein